VLVAQRIGRALERAFDAPRAGLVIAGFEVPHLHVHVFPAWDLTDFEFGRVDQHPDPAAMDDAAERIRAALAELGDDSGGGPAAGPRRAHGPDPASGPHR